MTANLLQYQVDREAIEAQFPKLKTEHTKITVYPVKAHSHQMPKTHPRKRQTPKISHYNGLKGKWLDFYEIASNLEHRVPIQDRDDVRHDILVELGKASCRIPLTKPAMIRIASYVIADYWRSQHRLNDGLDCHNCSKAKREDCRKRQNYDRCPKAFRLERLSKPIIDSEGNITELGLTIADDKAIDLDGWIDAKLFIEGYCIRGKDGKPVWKNASCPSRLLDIAEMIRDNKPLKAKDRQYLCRYRKAEQQALF